MLFSENYRVIVLFCRGLLLKLMMIKKLNFIQLLKLWIKDDKDLINWLLSKGDKYISYDI